LDKIEKKAICFNNIKPVVCDELLLTGNMLCTTVWPEQP